MGILSFPICAVDSRRFMGCAVTIESIKKSTNSDILAVGLLHLLMMGRPTNGVPSGGVLCSCISNFLQIVAVPEIEAVSS